MSYFEGFSVACIASGSVRVRRENWDESNFRAITRLETLASQASFSVTLMHQCNLTKSDESTFFVLNVYCVFVRNWVLPYINKNAKRSAASILMLYIHFPLSFPVTFGAR